VAIGRVFMLARFSESCLVLLVASRHRGATVEASAEIEWKHNCRS
jgi:hypothetical protein